MKSKSKTLAVLLLLILLLAVNLSMKYDRGSSELSNAQAASSIPSFLEFGFSPSTLSSAQDGIPVFAPNDELWILSNLNQSISLNLSSDGRGVESVSLPTSTAMRIYTFNNSDQEGNWTLSVAPPNSDAFQIEIPFVNPSDHNVAVSLAQYSIQNGQIGLGFSVTSSGAYDLEGCLSTNSTGTVDVPLPSKLGSGTVSISSNLRAANISFTGKLNQTFSFWYEVYHSYSYSGALPNEYISRDLEVIRSSSAFFSSASTQTVSLTNETTLRPGKYLIESFFESGLGLSVFESNELLLIDGQWYSLKGCNTFQITSSSFTEQVNIAQDYLNWPKTLYLMYEINGVDSYSVAPIQINLARIDFFGQPGNVKLTYLAYAISSPDILATSAYNGSIYVVVKSLPVSLNVTPEFGNEALSNYTVSISQQFSTEEIVVPVGRLTVQLLGSTESVRGIPIAVTNGRGGSVLGDTDPSGLVSFYLPSGSYNVWINRGQPTAFKNASITSASVTLVQFTVTPSGFPWYVPELLGGLLAVGMGLNLWVWIFRRRRIRRLNSQL